MTVLLTRHIGAHDPAAARPLIGFSPVAACDSVRTERNQSPHFSQVPTPRSPPSPGRACPWRRRDPDGARRPQDSCLLAEAPASSEPVQVERAPHSPVELITTGQRKIRGPRSALAAAQQTKGPKCQQMKGISRILAITHLKREIVAVLE